MAETNGEPDEIAFENDCTIVLESSLPRIETELTVRGMGWGRTIVDGRNAPASTGYGALAVWPRGSLTLDGVTIQNTNNTALYAAGVLLVKNSRFEHNWALDYGGAIGIQGSPEVRIEDSVFLANHAILGGAIGSVGGTLHIDRCTFAENWVAENDLGSGGAIGLSGGRVSIRDCTLADNHAQRSGGAVHCYTASVELDNVTMIGNTTQEQMEDLYLDGSRAILSHTIVGGGCRVTYGGGVTSRGHNLEWGDSCELDPALGDIISANPLLGPLQDNGGTMPTHGLLSGSPAIDAGEVCEVTRDQRGMPRPIDGDSDGTATCDIGAVEHQRMILHDGFERGDLSLWSRITSE